MKDLGAKEIESTLYQFSQLPEIIGTGEKYKVSIETVLTLSNGVTSKSDPVTKTFVTKPLPPENLHINDHEQQIFAWQRSPSPAVKNYKLKIRKAEENARAVDHWIEDNRSNKGYVTFICFFLFLFIEFAIIFKVLQCFKICLKWKSTLISLVKTINTFHLTNIQTIS